MVFRVIVASLVLALIISASLAYAEDKAPEANPIVLIKTNKGNIKVELDAVKAPISVKNFLDYVADKYYDGTIFHRVIDDFMIQGGGYKKDFTSAPTKAPIKNEANNGLKNLRGTIAMARTGEIDSATSQFFINVTSSDFLDHQDEDQGYGYAVFGKVIEGMDVVDRIKVVPTGPQGPFPSDVPQDTIEIISVTKIK